MPGMCVVIVRISPSGVTSTCCESKTFPSILSVSSIVRCVYRKWHTLPQIWSVARVVFTIEFDALRASSEPV